MQHNENSMETENTSGKTRYTLFEDIQGIIIASIQAALGIHLLRAAGLITGGTAGLALILSYLLGLSFGLVFFVINTPFFIFAYTAKGTLFAVKSLVTVTAVSVIAELIAPFFIIEQLHPGLSATLFGVAAGLGLLGLFRHQGSLGGISILALIIQEKFRVRAGWVQLTHDLVLFVIALFVFDIELVGWSLLGAVILNLVIALNHRKEWYVVT